MRVAVVGAGISGLTAAWRLQQRGVDVTVLEASEHVGGRMRTLEREGLQVDLGVHLLVEHYDRTRALAAEVGLAHDWFAFDAPAGGVLRDHQLTSFNPRSAFDVLRYKGVSFESRLRIFSYLLSVHGWRGEREFYDLSHGAHEHDEVNCDAWCREHLGDEVTDYLVDPFIRTFFFHSAREMSLSVFDALASKLVSTGGFTPSGFRGHMAALPSALADRLPVRTGVQVTGVCAMPRGVRLLIGDQHEDVDAVVLAVPGPVARELLQEPTTAQREVLQASRYSSTMLCAAAVRETVAAEFEGIWVPYVESWLLGGCANETCKGSNDGEWTVFSFGLHQEAAQLLWTRSDQEIQAIVAHEWARLFPRYRDELHPLWVQRWRHALPVHEPGSLARIRRFWEHGQGEGGVWLCGDWLNHPWVEGSVRCGEKVAERLADQAQADGRAG